jgi:TetR/AcrR family transcriptional repressor of lmrAB and yxaGH operons
MTVIIVNGVCVKRDAKEEMIDGALTLLAKNGLQATSFSEVLALTKAPRGSIYHHFPKGKNQLIGEALKLSEARTLAAIDQMTGEDAVKVTEGFLRLWHELLIRSNYTAGCSAVAVTVATDSKELLDRATSIFRSWRALLSQQLLKGGLSPKQAKQFATTLIAASEGAVVMCRAEKSMEPLDVVSGQLIDQAKSLLKARRSL